MERIYGVISGPVPSFVVAKLHTRTVQKSSLLLFHSVSITKTLSAFIGLWIDIQK
jgi:hypothetical protein